jgi:major coat protein
MPYGFQKMVDMAKTPSDVKKELKTMAMPSPAPPDVSVPSYPYGLCITITEEEIAKLGLDGDLPDVGDMIHLAAMAKVTSVSESEREDTGGGKTKCCRVELQITHLAALENESDEYEAPSREERVKKRYGEAEAA